MPREDYDPTEWEIIVRSVVRDDNRKNDDAAKQKQVRKKLDEEPEEV